MLRRPPTSFYVYVVFAGLASILATTFAAVVWQQRGKLRMPRIMEHDHLESAESPARRSRVG